MDNNDNLKEIDNLEENNQAVSTVEPIPDEIIQNNSSNISSNQNSEEEKKVVELNQTETLKQNEPSNKNNKNKGKVVVIVLLVLILIGAIIIGLLKFMPELLKKDTTNNVKQKKVYSEYRMDGNGLQKFDLSFLKLKNDNNNIIYSPLSIKYALGMLKEGANGQTKSQITDVIGNYKINKYINNSNMSFANAMFIRDTYQQSVKQEFVDQLKTNYNADIGYDSFQTPDKENAWVKEKTLGLIDNMFDDVSELDFILINALAIDMDWKQKIQWSSTKSSTVNPQMYNVDYLHEKFKESIVPIGSEEDYKSLAFDNKRMNAKAVEIGAAINNYNIVGELGEENIRKTITEEYTEYIKDKNNCFDENISVEEFVNNFIVELNSNYQKLDVSTDFMIYDDEQTKAFAKDLKEYSGTTLQYIGIMPKTQSINEYIESIDSKKLSAIINNLKTIENKNFADRKVTKITGYIPLFKFESELNLTKELPKLGIKDVFDSTKADLSNMVDTKNSYIDNASHKANIEFTNEGIKAAAATQGGGMGAANCGFEHLYDVPIEVIDMTFDKPYIFLIRDKNTGEVWFVGRVNTPIEKNN